MTTCVWVFKSLPILITSSVPLIYIIIRRTTIIVRDKESLDTAVVENTWISKHNNVSKV